MANSCRKTRPVLCLFLVVICSLTGASGQINTSEQQWPFPFGYVDLCFHFRGTCNTTCRFVNHQRWGVPLCPIYVNPSLQCCFEMPDNMTPRPWVSTTTTPTPPTTRAAEYATCGTQPSTRQKRIVGGSLSAEGRWPWLVTIRSWIGHHACTGAVVSQRWVITAAHCFKVFSFPRLWRIKVGEHDLIRHEHGEREIVIRDIIMHPNYSSVASNDTSYLKYLNDIALIQLDEDALTQPICLEPNQWPPTDLRNSIEENPEYEIENALYVPNPRFESRRVVVGGETDNEIPEVNYRPPEPENLSTHGTCWVAGWGETLDNLSQDQSIREVSGDVIDQEQCNQLWRTTLPNEMMCFGDGSFGPCSGDSGSPLACERNGHFYIAGVTSWGTESCNITGYPSVFTRVEPYLPWIRTIMSRSMNPAA
ncbi:elastase-1-like [Physella acuta]|uniref:elastase-1-like n=1 Tax=Physella acuta TaxID=109671 RepID=UPI0027DBAAF1|nr:elastase-1-like [Physella acuta]